MKTVNIRGNSKSIKMMSGEYTIRKNKKIDLHTPKIMAFDAGAVDNSFAICISHLEKIINIEDKYKRRFDVLTEIIPRDGKYLNFPDIYDQVIAPMIEEFNVIFVCADRWSSLDILQSLDRDFGIPWQQYTLKYKVFLNIVKSLYFNVYCCHGIPKSLSKL